MDENPVGQTQQANQVKEAAADVASFGGSAYLLQTSASSYIERLERWRQAIESDNHGHNLSPARLAQATERMEFVELTYEHMDDDLNSINSHATDLDAHLTSLVAAVRAGDRESFVQVSLNEVIYYHDVPGPLTSINELGMVLASRDLARDDLTAMRLRLSLMREAVDTLQEILGTLAFQQQEDEQPLGEEQRPSEEEQRSLEEVRRVLEEEQRSLEEEQQGSEEERQWTEEGRPQPRPEGHQDRETQERAKRRGKWRLLAARIRKRKKGQELQVPTGERQQQGQGQNQGQEPQQQSQQQGQGEGQGPGPWQGQWQGPWRGQEQEQETQQPQNEEQWSVQRAREWWEGYMKQWDE